MLALLPRRIVVQAFAVRAALVASALGWAFAAAPLRADGGSSRSPKSPLDVWRQRLDEAQKAHAAASSRALSAQARLGQLQGRIHRLTADLEAARQDADDEAQRLRDIEERALARLEEGHPLIEAWAEAERLRREYRRVEGEVFGTLHYRAQYREAMASRNPAERVADLNRRTREESEALRQAELAQLAAQRRYERLRREMLDDEPEWAEASRRSIEARQRIAELESALTAARTSLGVVTGSFRQAQRDLAAAEKAIHHARNQVRRLGGGGSSSSSANK